MTQLRLRVVPVVDGTTYGGLVYLRDVAHLPRSDWEVTTVGSVAQTAGPVADVSWTLAEALQAMEAADIERLAVLDGDGYVGLIATGEILKLDRILDDAERLTE